MKGSLQLGEIIGQGTSSGRWEIVASLGEGGYAEVYQVRDTLTAEAPHYALKIDTQQVKKDPRLATVRNEAEKLKRLQSCEGVPQLVEGGLGEHQGRSYVVMELFADDNLAVFQQKAALDIAAIKSIGHQTLKLLQNIHSSGWLHRDVKPANFVRTRDSDPASGGEWRIVDFGLAKPYISRDGDIIDARDGYNEFRGSTNYASVKAHQKEELGRRDDLWSWFYMLVELLQGKLLWRENRAPGKRASGSDDEAKKTAHRMKLRALSDPNTVFTSGRCPEAIVKMSRHLSALQFKESPNYNKLQAWLSELTPADVTRPLRPPAGKRHPGAALPGASVPAPAHPAYSQHAPAQNWHHPNGAHHPGNAALMNGHNGWAAPQNGGIHGGSNGVAWRDGRPMQMPPPGGWDASNHPLSQQELLDEAWDISPASYQQQGYPNNTSDAFASYNSQMSNQTEQGQAALHLSVPENWDQQLGQLGSEFGDDPDQAQPKLHQRKRAADRQLYADPAADLDEPVPKRARQSPAGLAAPPHLLEDEHGLLLHPALPDGSAAMPSAARPLWMSSSAAGRPVPAAAPGVSNPRRRSLSAALGAATTAAGSAAPAGAEQAGAAPSASPSGRGPAEASLRNALGSGSRGAPRSFAGDDRQGHPPNSATPEAKAAGMAAYGPAFLQKAISVFDEGRVSVNAKILKKIIPSMDPAEAYTGLAWAGWCIAQNTLPEAQTQASQMLDHLGDFFKGLARRGS